MNVGIKIEHAVKKYGNFTAIPDLSLDIRSGEFFTLLGPSGCGKTTLLRMIAGFNSIEGGDFYFGDRRINDLDPAKRNIGMVFQNYAIFPHLTVRKNVEFGLKNRKLPKDEIHSKADKFMELMKISEYADRLPEKLYDSAEQIFGFLFLLLSMVLHRKAFPVLPHLPDCRPVGNKTLQSIRRAFQSLCNLLVTEIR